MSVACSGIGKEKGRGSETPLPRYPVVNPGGPMKARFLVLLPVLALIGVLSHPGQPAYLGSASGNAATVCVERSVPKSPSMQAAASVLHLPVAFVPNQGQWDSPARYVARTGAMTMLLEESGWTLTCQHVTASEEVRFAGLPHEPAMPEHIVGVAIRFRFLGASTVDPKAEDALPGHFNFFLGNQPSKWRSRVPGYASVLYKQLYPGIDVRLRGLDSHLEYDLLLQPDADLDDLVVQIEGASALHVGDDGSLIADTPLGCLTQPLPHAWEEDASARKRELACQWISLGHGRFRFVIPERDPRTALVIDPSLIWSTFLGGASLDRVRAMAVDSNDVVTVAGVTASFNFPTTAGAWDQTQNGSNDAFVTRLNSGGTNLLWSTFLGGSLYDDAFGLTIHASGACVVAGTTISTDFPTTPGALDTSFNGAVDTFVAFLDGSGTQLAWSTFLGGSSVDASYAVGLDVLGSAVIVGKTDSPDFPVTTGAWDTTYNGAGGSNYGDCFICRLDTAGTQLVWSTFLGGSEDEYAYALAVDPSGVATLAGTTWSTTFPTTAGAWNVTLKGRYDGFSARFDPSGVLLWSTLIGGGSGDWITGLATDPLGQATVSGLTLSPDFPTTAGSWSPTYRGGARGWLLRLAPAGDHVLWSTFLGGTNADDVYVACGVDVATNVSVVGATGASNFPTTPGAWDRTYGGGSSDGFAGLLSSDGRQLLYSSYLGGGDYDIVLALGVEANEQVAVGGETRSAAFPTTPGALARTLIPPDTQAFVTRFRMIPNGVRRFGLPSVACLGAPTIHALDDATSGSATFGLACSNAPQNAQGALLVGAAEITPGFPVQGITIFTTPVLVLPASSDSKGEHSLTIPLPASTSGGTAYAQYLWLDPPCLQSLSSSDALAVTILTQ